jgi:hypothetical protein
MKSKYSILVVDDREIKPDVKIIMSTIYREGIEDLIDQNIYENVYRCIY